MDNSSVITKARLLSSSSLPSNFKIAKYIANDVELFTEWLYAYIQEREREKDAFGMLELRFLPLFPSSRCCTIYIYRKKARKKGIESATKRGLNPQDLGASLKWLDLQSLVDARAGNCRQNVCLSRRRSLYVYICI